jgi:hypothetical protein
MGWLTYWEGRGRKLTWPNRSNLSTFVWKRGKAQITCQNSRYPGRHSNRAPPEYMSRTLPIYHLVRKKYYERSVGKDLEGNHHGLFWRHLSGDYDDNHEVCSQHIWQRGWNLKTVTTKIVLKMERAGSFVMPDPTYRTTWCHAPEESLSWRSPQRKPLISYADVWLACSHAGETLIAVRTHCEPADLSGQRNLSVTRKRGAVRR